MEHAIIKVLLIGDYPIFRSALRMLIETDRRMRVVGEAGDKDAAAAILTHETPDMILVDMSDLGGEEMFQFFESIKTPVLILVGQHDPAMYQKCLRLGVSGLIQKEEKADILFKAIERIHDGEIWFDRTIMGATIRQLVTEQQMMNEHPKAHITNSLTDREMQVVDLICKGLKNRNVAEQLFITETTVRHHLTSVFNKLEITSRLELVVYAFKHGLVKSPAASALTNGNGNGHGYAAGQSAV